jgi:hypothetical protein
MTGTNTNSEKPFGWAAVVLLAVLVLLGRIPDLFVHYHDWDEAAMMAEAWAMTKGQVLYKDISQFHPILNLALWVPFFHIFRPEWVPLATKVMNLLLVFLGALLIGRIASEWLASRPLGLLGGALFIFYCSRPWAISSYGEFYLIFPVLCSVWLLFFTIEPKHPVIFCLTGFLWGVAFFLKQVAAFDAMGLYLGYLYLGRGSARSKLVATGLMALGFTSVAALTSFYFVYHGVLPEAWHSTFTRAMLYAHSGSGKLGLLIAFGRGIFAQLALSLPAIAGVVYLVLYPRDRPGADTLKGTAFFLVLWIWLCSDLVGLYAVGRAYNYYLTQVVAVASLLPLFILSQLEARVGKAVYLSFLVALTLALSADFAYAMLDLRGQHWVPLEVRRSAAAADYIKRHTRADDRIFFYRAENVDVFFLSQRLPSNGIYQYVDMMAEHMHDVAEQSRRRDEFLRHLPAVIVVNPKYGEGLADPFLEEVLKKRYSLKTTVEGLELYSPAHI